MKPSPSLFVFLTLFSALSLSSIFRSVLADVESVNVINGKELPGLVKGLTDTKTLVDDIRKDGQRVLAVRGTRLPGTRVPIHIHDYSGLTCVFSGEITDFVEGEKDQVFGAGDCYYMPHDTPMSAANLGKEPVILIDIFVLPPGEAPMRVIESGFMKKE